MFMEIRDNKNKESKISYEEFVDINDQELTCIFAESGADRELDFDREAEVENIYLGKDYTHLARTRKDYELELKIQRQNMIDFEIDEMLSMGHTQDEVDAHIQWKFNS